MLLRRFLAIFPIVLLLAGVVFAQEENEAESTTEPATAAEETGQPEQAEATRKG